MIMELKGVNKSFKENKVLVDFDLTVNQRERICIMGESGSGKTTLMRILLGVEKADSGSVVTVNNGEASVVFQENRLFDEISAEANIKAVAPKADAKKILASLGLFGENINKPVSSLSGGMKRRVAVARAIAFDAPVMFLDEPFKELDADTKELVIKAVNEAAGGKTLLLISHDPLDAEKLGCKTVMLKKITE